MTRKKRPSLVRTPPASEEFIEEHGEVEEAKRVDEVETVVAPDVIHVEAIKAVNFREAPSMTATVINVAKMGDTFLLLNRLDGWVEVATMYEPVRTGYLKSEFVKEV